MITREEYKFLKKIKTEGSEWIARDKNERLFVFQDIPRRYRKTWNFGGVAVNIQEEYFNFIKWEDEKPTRIDDLIRDYESHQIITSEKVKVKIPQFVADWIEECKPIFNLRRLFSTTHMPDSVQDWTSGDGDNCNLMALAWIYGYEIEKEKQYILKFSNGQYLYSCDLGMTDESLGCKLTQAEIEAVDPRLMQFAMEVE